MDGDIQDMFPPWFHRLVRQLIEDLIDPLRYQLINNPNFLPQNIHRIIWGCTFNYLIFNGVEESDIMTIMQRQMNRLNSQPFEFDDLAFDIQTVMEQESDEFKEDVFRIILETWAVLSIYDAVVEIICEKIFQEFVAMQIFSQIAITCNVFETTLVRMHCKLTEEMAAKKAAVVREIKEMQTEYTKLKNEE